MKTFCGVDCTEHVMDVRKQTVSLLEKNVWLQNTAGKVIRPFVN